MAEHVRATIGAPEQTSESRRQQQQQRKVIVNFDQVQEKLTATLVNRPPKFRFLSVLSTPDNLKVFSKGIDRTQEVKITVQKDCQMPGQLVEYPFTSEESDSITIELGLNPQLGVIDPTSYLERLIIGYQCEFKVKDQLWEVVSAHKRPAINTVIGSLLALGYDEGIVGPVIELLLADSRPSTSFGNGTLTNVIQG